MPRLGLLLFPTSGLLLFDHSDSLDLDELIELLDSGLEKLVVPLSWAKELIAVIPAERLYLQLDVANFSAVSDVLRNGVSGVLLKTPTLDIDLISSIAKFFKGSDVYVLPTPPSITPSRTVLRELQNIGATLVIPTSQLTLQDTSSTQLNMIDAFLASISSDPTRRGHTLGLVYSSIESIKESVITGKGVYQSRGRGLWRKGETSGATQDVIRISLDCDSDCLEYRVIQHGAGFCHLDRTSCFGKASGLPALEKTLQSRLNLAPEGSYTKRLFEDPELLQAKIMEEADELCRAEEAEDCVAAGVSISDIEKSLDRKAKKITRRQGNAKPQWTSPPPSASVVPPSTGRPIPPTDSQAPIKMRTSNLSSISAAERALLLRRPVLQIPGNDSQSSPLLSNKFVKMVTAALLELTAKFDRAKLEATTVLPPYPLESMNLVTEVKEAIDVAYANIRRFHEAQTTGETLKVETMPGVVCSRFARPISRVGLYVPGGTAILPSTALMLGIPAQVAGCEEIVLATPPRSDGSISPEVMYVAHLVGATAVLKAGAYGTETVPKVDKIFGPGNQWVTAAKMLVQNDTDALAFVAADLLSQAEHGVDSQVVLTAQVADIEEEVDKQAKALSRVSILRESVSKSLIVKTSSVEEAIAFSNDYAPEHLILHLENASSHLAAVKNAGSIFVGPFTPESCGDYASGTNHTLPTNGYARQFSGVNTQSFQKHITSQEITQDGLKALGPIVATLADCEGLAAHANAVRIRLNTY
ncbi:histidine biosynthesis trifunctional-protein [Flagelloscypha sp. PMI_526]|nr:histidine biosynthesis trifunctional-protein [Flagelloscypha sp. PMI_526]